MKKLVGIVIAQKNLKTATVSVVSYGQHDKYQKIVKSVKKFQVHYENTELKVGDTVVIEPSRPLSATKRFIVTEIRLKN